MLDRVKVDASGVDGIVVGASAVDGIGVDEISSWMRCGNGLRRVARGRHRGTMRLLI
jgi:hypothetical protein